MTRKNRQFVEALERAMAVSGDGLTDDNLRRALLASMSPPQRINDPKKRRAWALQRAKEKLLLTDVRTALREFYEVAGLDVLEAAKLHVKHIKGGIPLEKIFVHDGIVTRVKTKSAPSYKALRDYITAAIPQPAVRVDKRVLVGKITNDSPPIAARSIAEDTIEGETIDAN